MSSEILAALLGALAAGGFQTVVGIVDRKRTAEATLVAIASEVHALCNLIRLQDYLPETCEIVKAIDEDKWDGRTIIIDIRGNYFNVFESLSSSLGMLKPTQLVPIVSFYACCRSAIDCTRPDGPYAAGGSLEERAGNLRSLKTILETILTLGDEITQFPAQSIISNPI